MSIDWNNLPTLIGPRFRQILATRHDREKLGRAKMRRAKGPKNHATNRERSYEARMKAERLAKAYEERRAAWLILREQIRAYWRGERETHP